MAQTTTATPVTTTTQTTESRPAAPPSLFSPGFFSGLRRLDEMFRTRDWNELWPELGAAASGWSPRVDVSEKPDRYEVQAEIPGCKPEDIKVTLTGDTLTIQGEKRKDEKRKADNVHIYERSYGSFMRSFTFPSAVESESVTAESQDGVLQITVKKKEPQAAREVKVKATK